MTEIYGFPIYFQSLIKSYMNLKFENILRKSIFYE